jgi:hypothetical protein
VSEYEVSATLAGLPGPPGPEGPAGPRGVQGPPGASSAAYNYSLSTATNPPPTTGQARSDGLTGETSTWLYLSYRVATGDNVAPLLRNISTDDLLTVQDRTDATEYVEFIASGDAEDHPEVDYVAVPVAWVTSTTLGKNNQAITLFHSMRGAQGEPGVGVPAGGTTGQVLMKLSDDDFDTGWVTPT